MLISVIIPAFNRASSICRAIDSVMDQTYSSFELIVVDDGSTDDTKTICEKYLGLVKFKYFYIENQGVSAARNFGVSKASGDYVSFLDSDDRWFKNKLSKQVDLLNLRPDLKLIHGEEIWIRNGKRVNQMKKHQKFGGHIFEKCLALCLISPSAVMIQKDFFQSIGGFNEDFPVCEDYDLWLRITLKHEVGFVSEPIIEKYGGHEDQLSRKFKAMDYWRVRSMVELLSDNAESMSTKDKELTINQINLKAEILRNGYLKHGRAEECKKLDSLTSKVLN